MLPSFARRRTARWVALLAGSAALVAAAPAAAQTSGPTLNVVAAQDAVLATGLDFGSHTVQVTRPDALTGAPVVIGQYTGTVLGDLPFSVNMTVPSAANRDGDCWQPGALSLPGGVGLTPDIRPGDTVSVTGGPTVKVTDDLGRGPGGPISGCDAISKWGRNITNAAAQGTAGGDMTVNGVAQPLSTGVSVVATDGNRTTAPVDATVGADGAWSATIPASKLASLAAGKVTVQPVFAVPDVATGAVAHIAGVAMNADYSASLPGQNTGGQGGGNTGGNAGNQDAPKAGETIHLDGVRARMRISLAGARAGRLSASFIVPPGAHYVQVRLSRSGHTTLTRVVPAGKPGTRQTVRVRGAALRKLVRGDYMLSVSAGATRRQLGTHVVRRSLHIG